MQQNLKFFIYFAIFVKKFCIKANFHGYCLKSGKLGIYLTTNGGVKACLFRAQTPKDVQTTRKAARLAALIERCFSRKNFCTGSKN